MKTIKIIMLVIFTACTNAGQKPVEIESGQNKLQDGDLIFQTSISAQSKAIQLATNSEYSHVAIVFEQADRFFVFEAVQPVRSTPLEDWIKRGKKGHYVVKRLKTAIAS